MESIHINTSSQSHIDAYLEYTNIVGNADNGILFTPLQYEEYKLKAIEVRKNRWYTCWRNSNNIDCKNIGPVSKCFCDHRYKDHDTDNSTGIMKCRELGCKCKHYNYIPIHGNQDFKCHCKHSYALHSCINIKCIKCDCNKFKSSFACSCGLMYADHFTIMEKAETRIKDGRPVDTLSNNNGYEALGGITNFSSLVDGIDRLKFDGKEFQHTGAGNKPIIYNKPEQLENDNKFKNKNHIQEVEFDDNLIKVDAKQGKMTIDQEFAIYDQKYKKPSSSAPIRKTMQSTTSSIKTTPQIDISSKKIELVPETKPKTDMTSSLQLLKSRMKSGSSLSNLK